MTVVPPKLQTEALGKPEVRGEQRIFLCYFEKHGIMDGSILPISLRSVLTGGKIFLHRSRDYRAPAELPFPCDRLASGKVGKSLLGFGLRLRPFNCSPKSI